MDLEVVLITHLRADLSQDVEKAITQRGCVIHLGGLEIDASPLGRWVDRVNHWFSFRHPGIGLRLLGRCEHTITSFRFEQPFLEALLGVMTLAFQTHPIVFVFLLISYRC